MINLIPKDKKSNIAFARYNRIVLRWLIIMVVAVFGLFVIFGGSMFYIKQDIKAHETSIEDSKRSLAEQDEKKTLERIASISARMSLIVDVLSREVVFSKLLPHIGSIIPDGAALNGLTLSRDSQGGVDLVIAAVDYATASQALTNLQASESLLFESVDATNVNCDGVSNGIYQCQIEITAILVNDNPFLLLNQGEKNE